MPTGITDPKELAPFSCSYTANVPELLMKLNCSLAISTYQAGKVIFLSPKNEDQLIQLPRTFEKPMGIALLEDPDKMALACKDEVIVFANAAGTSSLFIWNRDGRYRRVKINIVPGDQLRYQERAFVIQPRLCDAPEYP